jgi:2-polyprenyl-3-methyl-5-hydroxy-6-metoxy-1,4-benzoquinol methylase
MQHERSRHSEATARRSLQETARRIFGDQDPASLERWITYWEGSHARNARLLQDFQRLVPVDFTGKRVLDIGCGTGGLGEIVQRAGGEYLGGDNHLHVLQFAESMPGRRFLQCSGVDLPFQDRFFDYIFAFDVIEHVAGGRPEQLRFLLELARVLKPMGMIFLTTPNRWYPYEGHSHLYFPHYLPSFLRNRYIGWRNPGFLKEHRSFSEIALLSPRALRRLLRASDLGFIHELPCTMDRRDFVRLHPLYGWTAYLGLGWYPHAEFWGILCRRGVRQKLRMKLTNSWYYEKDQPSGFEKDFTAQVDFRQGPYSAQLGKGWHWYEGPEEGCRWAKKEAVCYLRSPDPVQYCFLNGYSPVPNRLEVSIGPISGRNVRVGEHHVEAAAPFQLEYLIPLTDTAETMFKIHIRCRPLSSTNPADKRELGAMFFSIGLR